MTWSLTVEDIFLISVSCLAAAITLIWLRPAFERRSTSGDPQSKSRSAAVWIFDEDRLTDFSESANALVGCKIGDCAWGRVRAHLIERFPGFPENPPQQVLSTPLQLTHHGVSGSTILSIEAPAGLLRI